MPLGQVTAYFIGFIPHCGCFKIIIGLYALYIRFCTNQQCGLATRRLRLIQTVEIDYYSRLILLLFQ